MVDTAIKVKTDLDRDAEMVRTGFPGLGLAVAANGPGFAVRQPGFRVAGVEVGFDLGKGHGIKRSEG